MARMKSSAVTLFAIVLLGLRCLSAQGQAPMQGAPQGGPGGQGGQGGQARPAGPPQMIDLATAKKMAAAAEAAAAAENQHIAITIMDGRGDMVFFERMDTLNTIPVSTSQGKAHAVLMFGVPTGEIADAQKDGKPVPAMIKAPLAGAESISLMRGGLPIMKDGKMIGSIACGGSVSESDEKFAQAGIDAAFPKK